MFITGILKGRVVTPLPPLYYSFIDIIDIDIDIDSWILFFLWVLTQNYHYFVQVVSTWELSLVGFYVPFMCLLFFS